MTKLLFLVFLIGFLGSDFRSFAQEKKPLKILSWNIYMLPPLAKFTGKVKRAKHIGEILSTSDYDIIIFQEAFHKAARTQLEKRIKAAYPFRYGPANPTALFTANSGIWIISKTPLKEVGTIEFDLCQGMDCMSRKGALMLEGEHNGITFQVLGTHLESGGGPEGTLVRRSQYHELDTLLTSPNTKDGVPQILCGDFNTLYSNKEDYNYMVSTLKAENGPWDDAQQWTADSDLNDLKKWPGQSYIDYILYKPNGQLADIKRKVSIITHRWSKKHKDLSDHFGVEAIIDFK